MTTAAQPSQDADAIAVIADSIVRQRGEIWDGMFVSIDGCRRVAAAIYKSDAAVSYVANNPGEHDVDRIVRTALRLIDWEWAQA